MLVAPELYLVGYCACAADAERIAGPQHGPGAQALSELAAECRIAIVTGYAERYGSRIYKAACAFGPDGNALAQFRKLHVPVNFERSAFATGNRLVCFDWLGVRFGLLICYDLEFPEPIRALARLVVQVILVPTALSANWTRLTTTLVPTRAFENGLFVAYVNRCQIGSRHAALRRLRHCRSSGLRRCAGRHRRGAHHRQPRPRSHCQGARKAALPVGLESRGLGRSAGVGRPP